MLEHKNKCNNIFKVLKLFYIKIMSAAHLQSSNHSFKAPPDPPFPKHMQYSALFCKLLREEEQADRVSSYL